MGCLLLINTVVAINLCNLDAFEDYHRWLTLGAVEHSCELTFNDDTMAFSGTQGDICLQVGDYLGMEPTMSKHARDVKPYLEAKRKTFKTKKIGK